MHASHIAYVEVPAHDGVPQFDAAPARDLRRAQLRRSATDTFLRIFGADPASTGGVTRDAMDNLDAAARALLDLGMSSPVRLVLASTWDSADAHRRLWFRWADDDGYALTFVPEGEIDALAGDLATAPVEAFARGFLVELQRGRTAKHEPLDAVWESFQRALFRSAKPASARLPICDVRVPAAYPAVAPTLATPADPVAAAAAFREELLERGWPTSETVGQWNHAGANSRAQWAADQRAAGALLGVWSPRERAYRHPDFQFQDGLLNPKVKPLLTALAKLPGFAPDDDPTGWRRTFWLYGGRTSLAARPGGPPRTPADVFPHNPTAVIALADRDATVTVDLNDTY